MKFPRIKRPERGTAPTDFSPTNLEASSHPSYRKNVRAAKRAGKRGDPKPSMSTQAPSCFSALCHQTEDQVHHQIGAFLDEIKSARMRLASHVHIEDVLAGRSELTEAEERRAVNVQQARTQIQHAIDRVQPRLRSILAAHARTEADMKEAFRRHWPYAGHFQQLEFPILRLEDLRYLSNVGGLTFADLVPAQQQVSGPPSVPVVPIAKGVLS